MTWFDFSLLGILVLTTLFGIWNGLWWQVYRISSLVLAYILSVRFHAIGDMICGKVLDETTAKVAGCILVFVVVLGGTYLFGKVVKNALGTKPGIRGRVFGGILGLSKGALICGVSAFCLLEYNIAGQKEDLQISPLTRTFAVLGKKIAYIAPGRLRTGFEAFVKDTSVKTKEVAKEIPVLEEMANKFKQYKGEGDTAKE